jgi:hypothetical protein
MVNSLTMGSDRGEAGWGKLHAFQKRFGCIGEKFANFKIDRAREAQRAWAIAQEPQNSLSEPLGKRMFVKPKQFRTDSAIVADTNPAQSSIHGVDTRARHERQYKVIVALDHAELPRGIKCASHA